MEFEPYYFKKNFNNDDDEDYDIDAHELGNDEEPENLQQRRPIKLKDGRSWIRLRNRYAVVRTRQFSIQKNRENYFYRFVIL